MSFLVNDILEMISVSLLTQIKEWEKRRLSYPYKIGASSQIDGFPSQHNNIISYYTFIDVLLFKLVLLLISRHGSHRIFYLVFGTLAMYFMLI